MAREAGPLREETETERIQRWRAEELERAGYEPGAAFELSIRPDVDLHRALQLMGKSRERGLPPQFTAKIAKAEGVELQLAITLVENNCTPKLMKKILLI